jgi:hypothetical protein
MSRLQQLREMTPQEVQRVHRIHAMYGDDTEKVIELIADLRAYCGQAWPKMLEEALRRYKQSHRDPGLIMTIEEHVETHGRKKNE